MGAYRSEPDKQKISFTKSYNGIEFAVSHMCGWRLYMQDTAIEQFNFDNQDNHVFGIFDGHGGGQVAVFVKKHFVEELKKNQNYQKKNYQQALEETFQKIDKMLKTQKGQWEIRQIQNQLIFQDNLPKRDQKGCAGCTALVCLLAQRMLFVSNAGDSQAFVKKNGQFISMNNLHSPMVQSEKQRIEDAGGYVNEEGRINGCLNVSRSLGDLDFKSNKQLSSRKQMVISFPQILKESQQGVEYILMGCDGIWEEKQPNEIAQFIDERLKLGFELDKILEELFDWLICKEEQSEEKQLGKDNMSAILIRFPQQSSMKTQKMQFREDI